MTTKHFPGSKPLPLFENIEARLLLDSQIGTVARA